jgi:ERCC4-related helicase
VHIKLLARCFTNSSILLEYIGKVIFLAPTKPLVTQQINACHSIMGIPEEDIAHLEGTVSANKRAQFWSSRRVFFCTPQTLSNDLEHGRCDARTIVCLVVDEAHRATGQYAYTKVVEEIVQISKRFRVLALSATPGSDVKRVQAVSALTTSMPYCVTLVLCGLPRRL